MIAYLLQIMQHVVRILSLDRSLIASHTGHPASPDDSSSFSSSFDTNSCVMCTLRRLLRSMLDSSQSSHIFGVTERIIIFTTRMIRYMSDIDYTVLEMLMNMLDSKVSAFQRDGATKSLIEFPSLPPQCIPLLLDKIKTKDTTNIINYVEILCCHGYQSSIYDIVKNFLNPSNLEVNNWRQGYVEQAVKAIKILKINENKEDIAVIVDHLLVLLQKVKEDHWAEMEVITAISSLGYKDEKLINGLEMCLVEDKWGANSNGVRDAIVSTLQSFGVDPQGRKCMDILWRDKLQQGKNIKFRLCVLVGSLSLVLFLILFFTQMYGEIAALARVIQTTGKVVDLNFEFLPTACTDKLCYDILYPYTNHSMPNSRIGNALVLCAVVENNCDCCDRFPINSTISCFYDPQNPSSMFITKNHESYNWQFKVFNTFFWPGLLVLFPIASIWPLIFYAWKQSCVERGKHPLSFCLKYF